MAEPEPEPKHPYVTRQNGTVHFVFSIVVIILSIVQIILGIVISEDIVKAVTEYSNGGGDTYSLYGYDDLFHGDHVWVGFVGLTLAALGLSVWHTRARANGIMLSIMLFLAGFVIYPIAAALGGGYQEEFATIRVASAIYTALQALVIITWAFYTAFHACCNSKVKTQTRLNIPGGGTVAPVQTAAQPQVVYVQQPGQPMYVGGGQPVQYVGGAQPVQYVGAPQQPVYVVQQGPPQYVPQAQVQHGAPQQGQAPEYNDDNYGSPPSYAE